MKAVAIAKFGGPESLQYVDWADPVLAETVTIKQGHAIGAAGPGLGIKWNEKAVRKYSV